MSGNPKILQPGTTRRPIPRALVPAASLALLIIGCASPGPPRPPSLNLPKPVTDLTAERVGNQVLLHWSTPARSTDNLAIKGALTAVICRAEVPANTSHPSSSALRSATNPVPVSKPKSAPRKPAPALPSTSCVPILRLTVSSGNSSASDPLPSALTADPVALLDYRVEILNSAGHSAGQSNPAYAAAGSAPDPVNDLRATTIPNGAMLQWSPSAGSPSSTVELNRLNTSLPVSHAAGADKTQKSTPPLRSASQETPESHLRVPIDGRTGTLDLTARFGPTYRYTAQRVRAVEIGSHALEIRSLDSAPVTLTLRDTFPPATPAGLVAIPSQTATQRSIDLSWQSNSEPDLAGYYVYRRTVSGSNPSAPPTRLNSTPVRGPAFRDLSAIPGQLYGYTVTAVDTSGNESPPTPEIQETLPQP